MTSELLAIESREGNVLRLRARSRAEQLFGVRIEHVSDMQDVGHDVCAVWTEACEWRDAVRVDVISHHRIRWRKECADACAVLRFCAHRHFVSGSVSNEQIAIGWRTDRVGDWSVRWDGDMFAVGHKGDVPDVLSAGYLPPSSRDPAWDMPSLALFSHQPERWLARISAPIWMIPKDWAPSIDDEDGAGLVQREVLVEPLFSIVPFEDEVHRGFDFVMHG